MGWVRVDDHFDEHPKLARVGPIGWGFWLAGLAYCNRNLTDGFIPRSIARSLGDFEIEDRDGEALHLRVVNGTNANVTEIDAGWMADFLIDAGLWKKVRGGYRIHDFHDYQPSKEKVLSERDAKAARQAKWREQRDASNGHVDALRDEPVDVDVDALRDGVVEPAPNPTPREEAKASSSDRDATDTKSTEEDRKLCRLLGEQLKDRNPKAKVKSPSRWLTDMRLLRDRDNNAPGEIEAVIRWVFADEFWGTVIESPGSLREHFPKIWGQMQRLPANGRGVESSSAYLARQASS